MKITTLLSIQKILVILFFFVFGNTYGQVKSPSDKTLFGKPMTTKNSNPNNGIIRCATVEYEQFLQEKNPNRLNDAQFEAWLNPLVTKYKTTRNSSKIAATVITIPVVVHVVHSGQAVGTAPNITDAQVESQITILNQDFRKMIGTPGGASINPVAADIEIEFVLAKQDPDGNPTNGIDRVAFTQTSWAGRGNDIDLIVKPATIWDPTQYLNMWTLNISDDILGYAQFPEASGLSGLGSGGTAITDGVISSYDVFGSSDISPSFLLASPYDKGRTITHEIGHFLGLRHIWGDGTGDEASNLPDCTATDYCADTPQVGWEHYTCGNFDTCTSAAGVDMVENYMDYTNDACMNIFTQNQKDRITVIMNNAVRRSTLKTSIKGTAIPLFAIDAEVKIETDYSLDGVSDCASLPAPVNKKVILTNRGTSPLTAITLNYSIAGGANQTQNWTGTLTQNESTIVTLLNTASYGILTASIATSNGTTDQRASNDMHTKTFGPVNYNFTNYVFNLQQDFWGDEITWDLKDGSGVVEDSGGPYPGKHSEILPLPTLITRNWTLANNQFYTFTIYDSEGDGICCDGGSGYYNIKSTNGLTIVASGAEYTTIENIQFTTNTHILGNKEFETSNDIYLYPNPTKGILSISIPSNFGLPNSYTIANTLGQIILQKEVSAASDLTINISTLSNGIYFITLAKENEKKTMQFIKE
jgi:hypothetical protein